MLAFQVYEPTESTDCGLCRPYHPGYFNFKYFFLYLFYMWIGSIYSACMTWTYLG